MALITVSPSRGGDVGGSGGKWGGWGSREEDGKTKARLKREINDINKFDGCLFSERYMAVIHHPRQKKKSVIKAVIELFFISELPTLKNNKHIFRLL